MPNNSGAKGNEFGRTIGPMIARALGARVLGSGSNEAELNGQRIVVKCASPQTPSVGVTKQMLTRIDAVVGAFQNPDGTFEVISLPVAICRQEMYDSRSSGARGGGTKMINRATFRAQGTRITTGLDIKPKTTTLQSIVEDLNKLANSHSIGRLQNIRQELKGLKHKPTSHIFTPATTNEEWAFHLGGRTELQFNVGIEKISDEAMLRSGVAFSLEPSQSLPNIEVLFPKIRLFNEFLEMHQESLSIFRMWYFKGEQRHDLNLGPIPSEIATQGAFIVLGNLRPLASYDADLVLRDFDQLLPLYQFVESEGRVDGRVSLERNTFKFRAGCTKKASSTTASPAQRAIDIDLRHNMLQERLHAALSRQHGEKNVGTEIESGPGTSVDVVVQKAAEYWYYEIKTASSVRACLRQALGQLLEYAYWPGHKIPTRLFIAGEPALDEDGKAYLEILKTRFCLPLDYIQITQ